MWGHHWQVNPIWKCMYNHWPHGKFTKVNPCIKSLVSIIDLNPIPAIGVEAKKNLENPWGKAFRSDDLHSMGGFPGHLSGSYPLVSSIRLHPNGLISPTTVFSGWFFPSCPSYPEAWLFVYHHGPYDLMAIKGGWGKIPMVSPNLDIVGYP